jgi:hypothetical protein
MAYFKRIEIDETELAKLRKDCVYCRQLIAAVAQALTAMDSRLKAAAIWFDVMEFRTRHAEEVDPYED